MSERLTMLCRRATEVAEHLHGLRTDMEALFSKYETLRATYHDDEHEEHKDALEECMGRVGDAYKALKDMMSGNAVENVMDGGARRKHRKTRHRKTKKRQTRRR